MNMVNTGNMPTSLKRRSGHSSKPGASGDLAVPVLEVPVRDLVRTEAVRIGILPTARNFRAVMPVVSQTSSNRCSVIVRAAEAVPIPQDYHVDLNLSLREAAKTHKQILTVNGKQVRITIPAGVANGQVIKLKGYGGEGINGGPAGDLYITFVIPDDSVFKRLGDDLYVDVTVDLYTALLGGDQLVDTLDGQVKLKVKPETQNGTKVRLKGKGFPVYKKEGQFGDLIVTYSVKLPTNLTEQQKEMFRKIQSMN